MSAYYQLMDERLEEAQNLIRAGLAGTLQDCLSKCNQAIEMIQGVRDDLSKNGVDR